MRYLKLSAVALGCLVVALFVPTPVMVVMLALAAVFGVLAVRSVSARRRELPVSTPVEMPPRASMCEHDLYSERDRFFLDLYPGKDVRNQGKKYTVVADMAVADYILGEVRLAQHWFQLYSSAGTAWLIVQETSYHELHVLTWLTPATYDGPEPTLDDATIQVADETLLRDIVPCEHPYFDGFDYMGRPLGQVWYADYLLGGNEGGLRFMRMDRGDMQAFTLEKLFVFEVSVVGATHG